MRLFIALELSPEIHQTLKKIQNSLKKIIPEAKWVNPDNIHLTLEFLGETPEDKLPEIKARLVETASKFQPFTITLDKIGFFPNSQRPRVLWVGTRESIPGLETLHLTLARFKKPVKLPAEIKVEIPAVSAKINHITLFQSVLKPTGAIYTRLYSHPFPHFS